MNCPRSAEAASIRGSRQRDLVRNSAAAPPAGSGELRVAVTRFCANQLGPGDTGAPEASLNASSSSGPAAAAASSCRASVDGRPCEARERDPCPTGSECTPAADGGSDTRPCGELWAGFGARAGHVCARQMVSAAVRTVVGSRWMVRWRVSDPPCRQWRATQRCLSVHRYARPRPKARLHQGSKPPAPSWTASCALYVRRRRVLRREPDGADSGRSG